MFMIRTQIKLLSLAVDRIENELKAIHSLLHRQKETKDKQNKPQ